MGISAIILSLQMLSYYLLLSLFWVFSFQGEFIKVVFFFKYAPVHTVMANTKSFVLHPKMMNEGEVTNTIPIHAKAIHGQEPNEKNSLCCLVRREDVLFLPCQSQRLQPIKPSCKLIYVEQGRFPQSRLHCPVTQHEQPFKNM